MSEIEKVVQYQEDGMNERNGKMYLKSFPEQVRDIDGYDEEMEKVFDSYEDIYGEDFEVSIDIVGVSGIDESEYDSIESKNRSDIDAMYDVYQSGESYTDSEALTIIKAYQVEMEVTITGDAGKTTNTFVVYESGDGNYYMCVGNR